MVSFAEMFRSGGVWMYLIALLLMLAAPLSFGGFVMVVVGFFKRIGRGWHFGIGGGLLALTILILFVGFAGQQIGLLEMREALAHATPETREALVARGTELAGYPWMFALVSCVIPGLTAIGVLIRGFTIRADTAEI